MSVVRIATGRPGESDVYRHELGKNGLLSVLDPNIDTLFANFQHGVNKHPDNNCTGWRVGDGPYQFLTYKQVNDKIKAIGSGLINLGITAKSRLGVYATTRPEWTWTEQASNAYSMVIVALYDTLGPDACEFIVNQSEISTVFVASQKFSNIIDIIGKCPSIKHIIQYEEVTAAQRDQCASLKVSLHSLEELIQLGTDKPHQFIPPTKDDIATISYTSGTTGNPKGVILTHENMIANVAGLVRVLPPLTSADIHISYLPLAHVMERINQTAMWSYGCQVGFFRGDALKLMEDMQALRPTAFISVPRIFNRVYSKVISGVNEAGGWKKALWDRAFASKQYWLERGYLTHRFWDYLVFGKVRALLGGRVRYIVSSSAPVSAEVLDFLRIAFSCEVYEAYGQTETAGAATTTTSNGSALKGSVGMPTPSCEIKLVDVPDLGYLSTDKPHPRGEVCFRGPIVMPGYYRDAEKTAEAIDGDGWLHSGDIGLFDDSGKLRIVDRRKNIFKLAQGEYVAPEKIEQAYARSPFVAQVWVHGVSLKANLIAVVVPEPDQLKRWAASAGVAVSDLAELCRNKQAIDAVLGSMKAAAKEAKLRGFEEVKLVYLSPEPFGVENGLLTPSLKLKRPQAAKHFEQQINELYSRLD
eukprot:TRINITY_DN740_c0_g1_i1.p1 TRINITY_DN740_c0_g1~~TRINITY_DN740_c0_g1_i1.p1  ORF type:complete len:641 (+),score=168.99 TRINITY_DN740_c0_g1_i1:107-2029(+)